MKQSYKRNMENQIAAGTHSLEMLTGAIKKCNRSLEFYLSTAYGERTEECIAEISWLIRLRSRCIELLRSCYEIDLSKMETMVNAVRNPRIPSDDLLRQIDELVTASAEYNR